jgi:hypothetical protein
MASLDDIVSTMKGGVQNVGQLCQIIGTTAVANIVIALQSAVAGIDAINTGVTSINTSISTLSHVIASAFPQVMGSFTLSTATATIVTQPGVAANGVVLWNNPTNATAALTLRTQGLFLSAQTAGSGFVISTQTGVPTGGEHFSYVVVNPV